MLSVPWQLPNAICSFCAHCISYRLYLHPSQGQFQPFHSHISVTYKLSNYEIFYTVHVLKSYSLFRRDFGKKMVVLLVSGGFASTLTTRYCLPRAHNLRVRNDCHCIWS